MKLEYMRWLYEDLYQTFVLINLMRFGQIRMNSTLLDSRSIYGSLVGRDCWDSYMSGANYTWWHYVSHVTCLIWSW